MPEETPVGLRSGWSPGARPEADERRSHRISARSLRLILLAMSVLIAGFVGTNLFRVPAGAPQSQKPVETPLAQSAALPQTSPVSNTRAYALPTSEIPGLPVDASPGTRLEVWVAWDPPVTRGPRVQRLLDEVTLQRLVPPATPEGPTGAILEVKRSQVADLLFGDRWGSLSVVVLP